MVSALLQGQALSDACHRLGGKLCRWWRWRVLPPRPHLTSIVRITTISCVAQRPVVRTTVDNGTMGQPRCDQIGEGVEPSAGRSALIRATEPLPPNSYSSCIDHP